MSKIIPTLFVGLGGTGFYAISDIKKNIANKYFGGNPNFPLISFYAIDTEFLTADRIDKQLKNNPELEFVTTFDNNTIKDIERIETRVIPDNVKGILKNPGETGLEDFVPPKADECIDVKGDGASGVGLIGKIALANNFTNIANKAKSEIERLMGNDTLTRLRNTPEFADYDRENRMNIFIFCSFGGGTGKGMALIIAAMFKELLHEQFHGGRQKYNITIVNYLPACFRARGRSVANDESTYQYILKNQYATYKEFDWCMTHGYTNENFFKKYFNNNNNINRKTEDFINTIYNVSPNLEDSGAQLSSYESVNRIVSDVFTFLVMNPESYAILQNVSNDTQKVETSIPEKGTKLKRNRKYGRIGRYTLVMPEEELFEFTKTFYTEKLFSDFLKGGIEKSKAYEVVTGPQRDPETDMRPETLGEDENKKVYQIFNDHYNSAPQLNPGTLHFGDVRNYQVNDFINPIKKEIENFTTLKIGFEKSKRLEQTHRLIDEFVVKAIEYSGLLYARDFLNYLNRLLEVQVQELLENIQSKNEYGPRELLKGLGEKELFKRKAELAMFKFKVGAEVRIRLNEKLTEHILSLNEYTAPEKFNDISAKLEKLRTPKKKNFIEKLFKMDEDGKIPFPQEQQLLVGAIINKFNQQILKAWPVFIAHEYLVFAIKVHEHIENRLSRIYEFIISLNGYSGKEASDGNIFSSKKEAYKEGLLKYFETELTRKSVVVREANESNVIGDNIHDFKLFATKILPYDKILNDIHLQFNEDVVQNLFSHQSLSPNSDELIFKTMRLCLGRLKKERYDENDKKKWTILNYLKYLIDNKDEKTSQQVEENLLKIKSRSRFLASVDVHKFESPGAAETSFPQQNFLEISDKEFLPNKVTGWEEYVYKAKLIPQDDDSRITLTRVQGLIPLFAFTDLQEAQKLYKQSLLQAEKEDSKHEFKVKSHTSSFFMDGIDEPFGQTLQIDKNEVINIWNTAFHLGIVHTDESGYIRIIDSALKTEWIDYEDPSKKHIPLREKRRVRLNDFGNNYVDYFHLINTINELICDRLNMLAEDPAYGKSILKKYLADINYPILAKPLFNIIQNKLDKNNYSELIFRVSQMEQDYLSTYERIVDSLMRKREPISSQAHLASEYPGATQYLSFFADPSRTKGGKDKESNDTRNKKLEKVTNSTQWLLIFERDRESKLGEGKTMKWEDVEKVYAENTSTFREVNLYAPELDLILSYEEFKHLISMLELENKIRQAGLPLSVKEKKYHVVSKASGSSVLINGENMWGIDKVIECLKKGDETLLITENPKARKGDWKNWKEIKEINALFNSKSTEDEEIELPD